MVNLSEKPLPPLTPYQRHVLVAKAELCRNSYKKGEITIEAARRFVMGMVPDLQRCEAGDIFATFWPLTPQDLVLCRSADGWSLHAPGSSDEDIASGAAPYLTAGIGTVSDVAREMAFVAWKSSP